MRQGGPRDEVGRERNGRGKATKSAPGPGRRHGATQGGGSGEEGRRASPRRSAGAAPSQRQLRVGEEVRHVLAGIFARGEFRDPELSDAQVTVTEVRLSPDLKHATAFVARLGRSDVDALLPALRRAAPYLRSVLAQALRLRVAPEVSFQPDTALDYAMHVNQLLHRPEVARDLGVESEET